MAERTPSLDEEVLQLAMAMSLSYLDKESEDHPAENVSTAIPSAWREISEEIITGLEDFSSKRKRYSLLVKTIEKKMEDLTCPVCLETAAAPIYLTCQQMHFVCSECQPRVTTSCPVCREAYQRPPRRHRYAEREAQELKDLQEELANLRLEEERRPKAEMEKRRKAEEEKTRQEEEKEKKKVANMQEDLDRANARLAEQVRL